MPADAGAGQGLAGEVAWEACKENSQPIRQGRRAAALKSLGAADPAVVDERTAERQVWEAALRDSAAGADPLATWVAYIAWTQEAYVTGGKDAQLLQLLESCAYGFKEDARYADDVRYLRVWIQYADMVRDPEQIFDYLYDRHIGQNFALFWEAWASVLEVKRKYSAADKVRASSGKQNTKKGWPRHTTSPGPWLWTGASHKDLFC
jgi:hypothetical protein